MHNHIQPIVSAPSGDSLRARWQHFGGLWAIGLTFLLAVAAAPAAVAQIIPEASPTLVINDNIDDGVATYGGTYPHCATCPYTKWKDADNYYGSFQDGTSIPADAAGSWGSVSLFGYASKTQWAYLVPNISRPYDLSYDATKWTNIRIEFEFEIKQLSQDGFLWAAQDPDEDGFPESGYLFRIRGSKPSSSSTDDHPYLESDVTSGSECSAWDLFKITAEDTYQTIGTGFINSNCSNPSKPVPTYEVSDPSDWRTKYLTTGKPYRMRLSWFCGNLRVEIVRVVHPATETEPTFKGCGPACGVSGSTDVDDCWCTVVEWSPLPLEQPLGPGAAGIWTSYGYTTSTTYNEYDNLKFGYFDPSCDLICGDWLGWENAGGELIPFKFLYEGALWDASASRNHPDSNFRGYIDIATEAPAYDGTYNNAPDNDPYCNGWKLYEHLPEPTDLSGNVEDITKWLEPMSSAVDFESPGGVSPAFTWVDQFDPQEPAYQFLADGVTPDPDYNPLPLVADGSTPINSSLLQAFDWYKDKKTNSAWATDTYDSCRQWYVILITDGEEACEGENFDAVCDPGGGATKFANPGVTGVPPLPVYTIGFSDQVAEDSPLKCIADETGGSFMTAGNQTELKNALYEVFYEVEDQTRSFAPFKVAPPPSSAGGTATRDYLAVFPLFQPLEKKSLWAGNLWAFPLNKSQPVLPTIGDCEVDTTQMVWNAVDALQAQVDAHTEANPQRFVYMGEDFSGKWQRYDLATLPDDEDLRNEFKVLTGGTSDVIAQQIVNFLRMAYLDNDADSGTAGPPLDPRPDGYPVLGEFFHSQPVVVNPPNNPQYFYDFGFGVEGEQGVHDYGQFMIEKAKRRRLVLAGSNDGMLHAFDAGFWDRDRDAVDETYHEIHDLGNGTELFAWVPQAVMDRLDLITSGGSLNNQVPQYMVDGPIVKGDAFIDYDKSGDREWRTVALTSMRRGGRGILALDITQADPTSGAPDYVPVKSDFAGCRVGSTAGCDGEFPRVMWEFTDTGDSDTNGVADLGWTWSKPAIARIAINQGTDPPDDKFVVFFGGGWDENESDETGNFLYCVDLETGQVLFRENIGADVPGGVTALDSDIDGFHDRIYFGDSYGRIWRLSYPPPTDAAATGPLARTLTRIFDFNAGSPSLADRQEFFTRPIPVPARFDGSDYTWALALGSGDRAELDRTDSGFDHFYFLVDAGDGSTRGISSLVEIDYTELNAGFDCSGLAAQPLDPPKYGWYLSLRETEKVMFDASVLDGYVFFPTFDPSTATATNPPNSCETSSGTENRPDRTVECRASGIGRTYKLWYECGLGEYDEHNDIITGQEVVDIDGDTSVWWATSDPKNVPPKEDVLQNRQHEVTNWRQE